MITKTHVENVADKTISSVFKNERHRRAYSAISNSTEFGKYLDEVYFAVNRLEMTGELKNQHEANQFIIHAVIEYAKMRVGAAIRPV